MKIKFTHNAIKTQFIMELSDHASIGFVLHELARQGRTHTWELITPCA